MLELRDLHAHYGKSHVLQGVSFRAAPGEVVGLIGRNGVGKTTTLKAIMGLVRPTGGQVLVDGREVGGWPAYRIAAAGVGYVPEERRIFPRLTVLENLLVGIRQLPGPEQRARLDESFASFPRLRERLAQRGGSLSGGEQQMLALARSLVTRPRLVLIDEPTEGLMPAMTAEISRLVGQLAARQVGVVLVDQNLELLHGHCRVVHVMERGRVVESLAGAELVESAGVLRRYLGEA